MTAATEVLLITKAEPSSSGKTWQVYSGANRYTMQNEDRDDKPAVGEMIRATVEKRDFDGAPWWAITSFTRITDEQLAGAPPVTSRDPWTAPPLRKTNGVSGGAATFVAAIVSAAVHAGAKRDELGDWAREAKRVAGDVLGGS